MQRTNTTISIAALLSALALAGCASTATTATKVITVPFTSSAIHASKLPALYTCDGKDISPPLTWGAIPADIEELALFALEITPSATGHYTLTIDWAMAGVAPTVHHLAAAEIPPGAFVLGANNGKRRYSICPAKNQTTRYEFALFALPPHVHALPAIRSVELLSNLINTSPQTQAPAQGTLLATYART
jgi:phosphatidylethanolamine-binding protein (PEBP) family uncharacterized protein